MSWTWIVENSKWIFSGIGGTVLFGFLGFLANKKRRSYESVQTIESGDGSNSIQGRDNMDVRIGENHER